MGYLRTQFQEEQLEFKAKERPAAQAVGTKKTVDDFLQVCDVPMKEFSLRGISDMADTENFPMIRFI